MEELLDRISQEGLLVVCVVLAAVALLLAIVIVVEIIISKKKANYIVIEEKPKESKPLNIKYDENITYVDENSEEERRKAKAELEHIKNRLIEEDNKKKLDEEQVSLKIENKTENKEPSVKEEADDLSGTKEYKVFNIDETITNKVEETKEEVKEDKKDELYNTIDNMLENGGENKQEEVETPKLNDNIDVKNMNIVYPVSFNNISSLNNREEIKEEVKEVVNEAVKEDLIPEENNIEVEPIEPIVIEPLQDEPEDESYRAKRDTDVIIEEPKEEIIDIEQEEIAKEPEPTVVEEKVEVVEETPVQEEVKTVEEEKEEKLSNTQKIDNATKERIIDEYLKQAILTRINEEKEKQLKLKEQIEKERKVLLFDEDNLDIIDSYEDVDLKDETLENINILEKLENDIIEEPAPVETPVVETPVVEEPKQEEKRPSLYEELEEENAIISYDELLKATKFGYTDEEMNNYLDEKDAIISIDELDNLFKEVNNIAKKDNKLDFSNVEFKRVEDLPKISDEKKFKKSDIISPVYGINNNNADTDVELEETLNLNRLSEEIKKTNDFLATLKDLQKNLD